MNQQYLFEPIPCDKYDLLSKDEVVQLNKGYEDLNRQMREYIEELHSELVKSEQKEFLINEVIRRESFFSKFLKF